MYPILVKFQSFALYSYGLFVALGFLAGLFVIWSLARDEEIEEEKLFDGVLIAFFSGLVGARFYYVFFNWDLFAGDLLRVVHLVAYPGLGILGGLLGGFLGLFVYTKANKLSLTRLADIGVIGLALGQAVGRVGCFLNGCCYGKETSAFWGVNFPGLSGRRHPTQLYESVLALFIFFILLFIRKKWSYITGKSFREGKRGGIALLYFFLYGVVRLVLEFFRDDGVYYGGLNPTIVVSIIFIIGSLLAILIGFRKELIYFATKCRGDVKKVKFSELIKLKFQENFGWVTKFFRSK